MNPLRFTLYTPKDMQKHALNPPENNRIVLAWNVNTCRYEKAFYDRETRKWYNENNRPITIDGWWELK